MPCELLTLLLILVCQFRAQHSTNYPLEDSISYAHYILYIFIHFNVFDMLYVGIMQYTHTPHIRAPSIGKVSIDMVDYWALYSQWYTRIYVGWLVHQSGAQRPLRLYFLIYSICALTRTHSKSQLAELCLKYRNQLKYYVFN